MKHVARVSMTSAVSMHAALIPAFIAAFVPLAFPPAAHAQREIWRTEFNTPESDAFVAIASDGTGGHFVGGYSLDIFEQPTARLLRYDADGALIWSKVIVISGLRNSISALTPDGEGGVFVAGRTGSRDIWLARYDSTGSRMWITEFGAPEWDWPTALATDGVGGAFIAGWTRGSTGGPFAGGDDVWIARYDNAGNRLWIDQFGTNGLESPGGLATDGAGGVFFAGTTNRSLGGPSAGREDAWLARYGAGGNQIWIKQYGTIDAERFYDVSPDAAGGVFVCGKRIDLLNFVGDILLARIDGDGNQLWERQIRLIDWWSVAYDVMPDGAGGMVASGHSGGHPKGPNSGLNFASLWRYSASGDQIWSIEPFGVPQYEGVSDLAPDGEGGMMVTGSTRSNANSNNWITYLARYNIDLCYADCDRSTGLAVLDIFDFLCWQNSFVMSEPYACDCDTSTGVGVCDVFDFLCFQSAFVGGCP